MKIIALSVLSLVLTVSLSACMQTTYRSTDQSRADLETFGRRVEFLVSKEFYRDPPDCVVVLRSSGLARTNHRRMIERAAARHLSGKFKQVMGPDERDVLLRRLALDLNHGGDRNRFAKMQRCRHFARLEIRNIEENYAFIWSHRRVDLAMAIYSVAGEKPLWRAAHSAGRGDGGLPLSPLSLGAAAISAGRMHGDRDVLPSIIEDAFRRMLVTLPDVRNF